LQNRALFGDQFRRLVVPAAFAGSTPIFTETKMKKLIFLVIVARLFAAATGVIAQPSAQKYTCPMHREVVMDGPGQCPKCGMTLVPLIPEKKHPTSNVQRPTSNEEE